MPYCKYTVQVKCMPEVRGEIKGFESEPQHIILQTDEDGKQF